MVRLFGFILFLGLAFAVGCSEDDGVGPDPDPVTRLVASSTATEPTMSSPDEATWSMVTGTTTNLKGSGAIAKTNAAASSVDVKAIVKSSRLYLRMEWTDDSLHIWRDAWSLTDSITVFFTHNFVFDEDQAFLMLKMPNDPSWDVWNWRLLTTGSVELAEGKTYNGTSFVSDAGAQTPVKENIQLPPFEESPRPRWIHNTKSAFEESLLYMSEAVDGVSAGFGTGWRVGQKVAGWVPDLSVLTLLQQNPESRWDIETVHSYDAGTNKYKLVMVRDLDTGFTDDLDLSTLDSVQIKVGVVDNQDDVGANNNSSQRFSDSFWLVLP